jgi:hypothetical protein
MKRALLSRSPALFYGPTVEDIIEKAKQLCRLDGMLWSKIDFQNPMGIQSQTARMAGDVDQQRYLKRAQALLEVGAGFEG